MKYEGAFLVVCCALMSSCGGDGFVPGPGAPAAHEEVRRSPVVLTSIPDVLITKRLYNRAVLRIAPSSSEAKFFYGGTSSSIDFPNSAILAAREREVASVLYVLLSVVDRTTETCTIYRVHDSDGDGLPDAPTKLALAGSGAKKSYVTSISAGRHGTLYLLDRRCQDVFPFEDTDQDGWEDTWGSSPIVRSQDYPYLQDARAVFGGDGSVPTVRVYAQESPLEVSLAMPVDFREYADTDGDGLADTETIHDQSGAPPRFGVPPQEGVSSVTVDYTRGGGSANTVVEAWLLDAQGAEQTLLGSVTIDASLAGTITLTSSLSQGEHVALKRSGATSRSAATVWPLGPTILDVSPAQVVEKVASPLVITGHGFTTESRAWLRDSEGSHVMLATTYVGANELHAQVPADTLLAGVRAYLCVFDQGASGEFTVAAANYIHLVVCAAE